MFAQPNNNEHALFFYFLFPLELLAAFSLRQF